MRNDEKFSSFKLSGEVVKGFGRGSKQLGIPTANFPDDVVTGLPEDISNGIYYGWARVGGTRNDVREMVMSVGFNPYYNNEKRTAETHILHEFDEDFYGQHLDVIVLGYIRPEMNFKSLDELILAIKDDIRIAKEKLQSSECQHEKITLEKGNTS